MYIEFVWGACGFAVGVVLATICLLVGAWIDDRGNER